MELSNIDNAEIAKFATMADYWWNRNGVFKSLHDINPVRLEYICSRADLKGKSVLDVGCGSMSKLLIAGEKPFSDPAASIKTAV